jgi:hypothetical protein
MTSTKIDLSHNRISRAEDLDELAAVLSPRNKNHQRAFLAIWVELKWAPDQFLPTLEPIAHKHQLSPRTLETTRAKMRRLGLIDHVSRFGAKHGYREGWVLSTKFQRALERLAVLYGRLREKKGLRQEEKDRRVIEFA